MWKNEFEKDGKFLNPVSKQCKELTLIPYYCAMIGTSYGVNRIQKNAIEVQLSFAHILNENVSPLHADATTWPSHLKISGPDFILTASEIAGIPKHLIRGFHDLGLSLAFSFTIPDATLPIFRWNSGGWSPLMEKS